MRCGFPRWSARPTGSKWNTRTRNLCKPWWEPWCRTVPPSPPRPRPSPWAKAPAHHSTGEAGGAQKVYWIRKENGTETLLAIDQFTLDVNAGRVTGDQSFIIQFKGIYPTEVRTVDIPVTITENIADPEFTLSGPSSWDGRETITVTPDISNLAALQAQGFDDFTYTWSVNGVAVNKQITPGMLTLKHAQGDGPMTVTLVMDNGGALVSHSKIITVQQPPTDAWVQRDARCEREAGGQSVFRPRSRGLRHDPLQGHPGWHARHGVSQSLYDRYGRRTCFTRPTARRWWLGPMPSPRRSRRAR